MGIRVRVNKSQLPALMNQISQAARRGAETAAKEVKEEAAAGLPGHWLLAKSFTITSSSIRDRRFVFHVIADKSFAFHHEYGSYRRTNLSSTVTFDGKKRSNQSRYYGLKIHNKRRRFMKNAQIAVKKRYKPIVATEVKEAVS
jgi:hypothetical protein